MKEESEKQFLYRIMPLEELVQMCENPRKIVLRSPRLWEDTYEGFFYTKLMTEEGMEKTYKFLNRLYPHGKKLFGMEINSKSETVCYKIIQTIINHYLFFAISCTKNSNDSDAMWRIYSYGNKSLRIKFDWHFLKKKLKNLWSIEIDYINKNYDFNKELEKIFKFDSNSQEIKTYLNIPFSTKRKLFEHEDEIRIIYNHKLVSDFLSGIQLPEKFKNDKLSGLKTGIKTVCNNKVFDANKFLKMTKTYLEGFTEDTTTNINVEEFGLQTNEFIKGVLVHPQAPDYYACIVKKYCENHNLNFDGRSKLYTFEEKEIDCEKI